ncbi:MAG: galactose-1-phosphate uridylyltransferase [Candidatus Zixiibacteriota bacterium]
MSEFRQNRATKEWVIIAPERGKRPSDEPEPLIKREPILSHSDTCPFCPGNEEKTPSAIFHMNHAGQWKLRVVPNRFAALSPDIPVTRNFVGSFLSATGFGIAEVIIENPQHNLTIATMSVEEVTSILYAYRERQREVSKNESINLVTIFRNHGPGAGTSLEHPHSQLIATPIIPPHVRYPLEQAVLHYDKYGTCVFCDNYIEELKQKERIIIESPHFVVFCPYASKSPYETRIYPKRHQASFLSISDDDISELADALHQILVRIYKLLGNPDYNYIIRSSPTGDEDSRYLHWYMIIIPKVSTPAGFEIGSGIYINTVAPEDAARRLREVTID